MAFRRLLLIIASIAVSGISVALILRDVPLDQIMGGIRAADPLQLLLSFVFATLSLVTRGIRWWGLLGKRLALRRACHIVNIMALGNQLPLRLGELARGLLARGEGVPIATSASSIVIERLVDTLFVVLMIAASVSALPDVPPQVTQGAALFGVGAAIACLVLLIMARRPEGAKGLIDKLMDAVPALRRLPLQRLFADLMEGLHALTDRRTFFFTLIWSVIAWAASLATFYCLHQALDIQVDSLRSVPLGVSLAALAIAIPVSVAALGPFEGAIIVTGQAVGMDALTAVTLGFLFHGISVAAYLVWGVLGMLALGISPGRAFAIGGERGAGAG